jgi:[ribosomal protein S5]-alanine N-acetyltransferase
MIEEKARDPSHSWASAAPSRSTLVGLKKMLPLPKELPVLQSERLLLRALADEDAEALFAIYSDAHVMRFTEEQPFSDLATVRVMLQSVQRLLAQGESLEWAVVVKTSQCLIGTCGLHSFNVAAQAAEIGCLLKRSAWGQGYMHEAMVCLTAFAKDILRLRHLRADVAQENTRAVALFQKLGFKREADGCFGFALGLAQPVVPADGPASASL